MTTVLAAPALDDIADWGVVVLICLAAATAGAAIGVWATFAHPRVGDTSATNLFLALVVVAIALCVGAGLMSLGGSLPLSVAVTAYLAAIAASIGFLGGVIAGVRKQKRVDRQSQHD